MMVVNLEMNCVFFRHELHAIRVEMATLKSHEGRLEDRLVAENDSIR